MLLEALVACAGVTLEAVATAIGITCGMPVYAPRAQEQVAQLIKLTERYCVALNQKPVLSVTMLAN